MVDRPSGSSHPLDHIKMRVNEEKRNGNNENGPSVEKRHLPFLRMARSRWPVGDE